MNKTIILGAVAVASVFAATVLTMSLSGKELLLPDTMAPTIIRVKTKQIAATNATISWFTDEPTASRVYYSATTPVTFATAMVTMSDILEECEGDKRSRFKQEVIIPDLTAETTYYFIVESADASGNGTSTTEMSFMTKELRGRADKLKEPEELEPKCKPSKIKVRPKKQTDQTEDRVN